MLWRGWGSFRMGMDLTSILHSALHMAESILQHMTWVSTVTWDTHNPKSDAKRETLSTLPQMLQRSTQERTKISRIPPPRSFQEVKIADVLAPHPPWTSPVVQHLPLSLSYSEVWSSGNQWVGVWYIFFKLYGKDCTLLILPDIYDSCQAGELF